MPFRLAALLLTPAARSFAGGLGDLALTPVPEPALLLLVGFGLLAVGGWRRHR